ncbi:hypothetical protein [Hymenobacter guriensis]|uniref:Secreted protein n=1 Tax=Hymenobacter guriensis TaxID=2793065 RepID=A0ABS0KW46_9BACT|nr:hypothetical protein [Hymenobacter guriensis]MBG8552021.1 hypothetical protein [Hymenobacter guriensis]
MTRLLALFLTCLILLQTFSRELLVVNYQLQKEQITRLFCINKAKPRMRCNGRCHLAKQLRKATETERKAPQLGFAKLKYEVLPPLVCFVPSPLPAYTPAAKFAASVASCYAFAPAYSLLHPPALHV